MGAPGDAEACAGGRAACWPTAPVRS